MTRSEGRLSALETVLQSAGRIFIHWQEEMIVELLSCVEALLLEDDDDENGDDEN